jgi:DNA (cytosine-5)-methyltransferase 1
MMPPTIDVRERRQQLGLSQAKLAELADVPQRVLSAVELGKVELTGELLQKVLAALSDPKRIRTLVLRRKRYTKHVYTSPRRSEDRVVQAATTPGNAEYVSTLVDLDRRHRDTRSLSLSAVSLFAGLGGLSLGFSAAGFAIKGFVERDASLRAIYQANFPTCAELGRDITEVPQGVLEQHARHLGSLDVVIGGPPCQGFSLSGKRKVDDPRNTLFRHYLRFVDILNPRIAILENVKLLTSMTDPSGSYVKDHICHEFESHGYSVRLFEINACRFGVPQHRERVIFMAVRHDLGIKPSFPETTHGGYRDLFCSQRPYRSFGDACSDLPYLEAGEKSRDPFHCAVNHPVHVINWLWDVQQGRSAHENGEEHLRPPSGYNTTYKRQIWHDPASTVQTTFGMISGCRNVHPIATRSLTIREAARIQSFPDGYIFQGTAGTIRTGIGNAVPPLLALAIAQHIKYLLK